MMKSLRRWWQVRTGQAATPFDGEAPFYIFSLVFHVALVLALASVFFTPNTRRDLVYDFEPETEIVDDIVITDLAINDMPQESLGNMGEALDEGLRSEAQTIAFQALAPVSDFKLPDDFGTTFSPETAELFAAENASDRQFVKGVSGVGVAGASGAIDQITDEILRTADKGPVLTIWLFDQSASLQRQRGEIQKRFDRVYRELDAILEFSNPDNDDKDAVLLTQIYQYGNGLTPMLAQPSRNVDEIVATFDKIQNDESGVERTFAAVAQTISDHRQYLRDSKLSAKRQVMIFVVTDEVGDDYGLLDSTIDVCRRATAPVYVVGVPAPFGRKETPVKWIDPDPAFDQTPQWTAVNQGPESLMPERLKLGFFGNPQDDLDIMDSGFGPYALSRLAVETGGIYFAVHPNRTDSNRRVSAYQTLAFSSHMNYFFDSSVMQRYRPDYVSIDRYNQNLKNNPCRESVVRAALQSDVGALVTPALRFPKLDEADFVNSVSQAQRAAALLEPQIEQLYLILAIGENGRDRELVPRWQAAYDLAMGRVLTAKVRTEAYNAMLAAAKTRLKFEDPKNNTWQLVAADSIDAGSRLEKMAEQASSYLNRVVEQHPRTPWAMLASRELSTPLGWQWEESFTQPPRPPEMQQANNNNNIPAPSNDRAMMLDRKPRRAPPKL